MKEFLTEWLITYGTGWVWRNKDNDTNIHCAWHLDYMEGRDGEGNWFHKQFRLTPRALKFIGEANET